MLSRSRLSIPLFASICLTFSACQQAIPDTVSAPQNTEEAAALLAPWLSDNAPGVAVSIMRDGEVVFSQGVGLANLEHGAPITPETVFNVASVSKQFTAFSIMLLESDGKLSLDDDIRAYLPGLQDTGHVTTIKHLLNHTGGYREQNLLLAMTGWQESDTLTNAQLMDLLTNQTGRNFAPGARVEYSNTGYFLLSQIVERVSGLTFEAFTKERVFSPLGMTHTQFRTDRSLIIQNRAISYTPAGETYRQFISNTEHTGSTGLHTTVTDLLKWAQNFETQTIGDASVFVHMAERSVAENGELAIFANGQELRPYKGLTTWSHGGRDAGYRSFVLRIPDQHFAIAILSNRADFDTAKIAFALTDVFLGGDNAYQETPPMAWTAASQQQLSDYSGEYELFPGLIFSITANDKDLFFANLGATDKSVLPQIGDRQFSLNPDSDISIVFAEPGAGMSPSFAYTIGLHGSIRANRIALEPFDPQTTALQDFEVICTSKELSTSYNFRVKDGVLTAKHIRSPAIALTPYQTDTFNAPSGGFQKVEFVRNIHGRVVKCLVSAPLAVDVEFNRVDDPIGGK